MTARTMKALLWKDLRVNRTILLISLILWVSPFVVHFAVGAYYSAAGTPISAATRGFLAVTPSFLTVMLAFAMLGGNVMAAERVDRSAAFLAYLPPSRLAVLASKAICGLTPCLLDFMQRVVVDGHLWQAG